MLALGEDVGDVYKSYHFEPLVLRTPLNYYFSILELGVYDIRETLQLLGLVVVAAPVRLVRAVYAAFRGLAFGGAHKLFVIEPAVVVAGQSSLFHDQGVL